MLQKLADVLVNNRIVLEADIRNAQAAAARLGLEVIVVNGGAETRSRRRSRLRSSRPLVLCLSVQTRS
jgi:hypothetical protein